MSAHTDSIILCHAYNLKIVSHADTLFSWLWCLLLVAVVLRWLVLVGAVAGSGGCECVRWLVLMNVVASSGRCGGW